MIFLDEDILKKRELIKSRKYTTLEDGYYIQGKIVTFERKELLGKFSICLPDMMRDMPEPFARIKYPSEFRPDIIFTTLDLSVNMGFSILRNNLQTKEVDQVTDRMMRTIHRANPTFLFYQIENIEATKAAWFSFRGRSLDSDLYHMMMITPIGDELVFGVFNCIYQYYQEWKQAVLPMWESVEPVKRKGFLQ